MPPAEDGSFKGRFGMKGMGPGVQPLIERVQESTRLELVSFKQS